MDPLVSVIVTTYNLGWCIQDTLRSVFAQTYANTEIIVVDDASTDDTPARMAPFLDRVKYIRHATNQGIAQHAEGGPARNSGLRVATGEFIAFLDGDDAWEPEKLAVQVEAARRFPQCGLVVADGILFAHEDGHTIKSTLLHDYGDTLCSSLPAGAVQVADLYPHFLRGCVIDTPSQVLVPAKVFHTVGRFSQCHADDYEFYLRVATRFDVLLIKRPLVRYRYHVSSVSGALDRQLFRFAQPNIDIWRRHLKVCRPGVEPQLRRSLQQFMKHVANSALARGQRGEKAWASRFLWRLLISNLRQRGARAIASAFIRLWSPPWLVRVARRQHAPAT